MMNVLVVHDRSEISDEIGQIAEKGASEHVNVIVAKDASSARKALRSTLFDLAIIDLTLPNIHGSDAPSIENANLLLREIFLLDEVLVPADIIGVTLDISALDRIKNDIGHHVMAIIHEDREGLWRVKLAEKIRYSFRAARARFESIVAQHDIDCLIICALDEEIRPYFEAFDAYPVERLPGCRSFLFKDKHGSSRRGLLYAIGKSGEARAASATQSLIYRYRPKAIFMSGICGGVKGKVKLGDLIIADSAIDWDYGKWVEVEAGDSSTSPAFQARPDPVSISGTKSEDEVRDFLHSSLLSEQSFVKMVQQKTIGKIMAPEVHFAPMASGSAVVASEEMLGRIRTLNDSIRGIDMETFGIYYASKHTACIKPTCLCVKSAADFANGFKNDEYHDACCTYSALVVALLMTKSWSF